MITPLPTAPCTSISIDFYGLPTGEEDMVVTDDYSRYPELAEIKSTAAQLVCPILDTIFAHHGRPEIIRSDNGPPFKGKKFEDFCQNRGIAHRRVMPLWPNANGQVECFMRTLKKRVQTATVAGSNWKTGIHQFLLNYRASPHSTTGVAPAKLLFNRDIRTKLPELPPTQPDGNHHDTARSHDEKRKADIRKYADNKKKVKLP